MSATAGAKHPFDTIILQNELKHLMSRSIDIESLANVEENNKKFLIQDSQDLKIQELLIVKDLLSVLVGLKGQYVRYSKKFDMSFDAIVGPTFNVTKHLDPSLSDIVRRCVKFGKYYYGLMAFTEIYDDQLNGKISQSLCFEIRNFLKEYLSLIIEIEHHFHYNSSYSLRLLEQELNNQVTMKLTHCYEIVVSIYHDNVERSQHLESHFSSLIREIKNDLQQTGAIDLHADSSNSRIVKGGLVLQVIEKKLDSVMGDPVSSQFLGYLFDNVSQDYIRMLNDWLLKGQFQDPYDEFMIKVSNSNSSSVYSESYWDNKFSLRKEGLIKQFVHREVQYKILLTGKYLNILKESGIDVDSIATEILITSLTSNDLYLQIDLAYRRSNQLISNLYFKGFNLVEFLSSLKKFYLFDNIHNFNNFLNLSITELKKTGDLVSEATLIRHFMTSYSSEDDESGEKSDPQSESDKLVYNLINLTIERSTVYNYLLEILNVQPIDADEALSSSSTDFNFLKNLLNKTLESERNDLHKSSTNSKTDHYAINKLNFDISLPFPLNLLITRSFVTQYQLISRHIMIIKFIDKLLENSWKEINFQKFWKYSYADGRINKWMLRARVLHSRMKDFIRVLQFYISIDVIETNWLIFKDFLSTEFRDGNENFEFEKVYQSLQTFINSVFTNCFLTSEHLINLINKLFAIVILYSNFLNSLRKTLVLLDENLYNEYESKMNDKVFDEEKNAERIVKLNNVSNNYDTNFTEILKELNNGLKFRGETECFAFLQLSEKLELAGLI